ncbi:gastric triacylglycerol lipase-like protein 2 [Leptotrombidium deliense]|uniref:Gastric triacylglycerol lipase-like protein 2 n=1 Tax=Leptotrombidium deliense TaxID=299467 RepID=A0A443RT06_9ACAR|nr:gastric triacylglycerol lipase-like protein 2 [Leptotrombidium deliense]
MITNQFPSITDSPNFFIYPDAKRTIIEIIKSRNLKPEIHRVTTDDGYILTLHRIVNESSTVKDKRPVIIQHGLESCATDFLINSPDLGIEFSKATFDGKVVSNNIGFALSRKPIQS